MKSSSGGAESEGAPSEAAQAIAMRCDDHDSDCNSPNLMDADELDRREECALVGCTFYDQADWLAREIDALCSKRVAEAKPPPDWEWTHERQARLIAQDGMMCEAHPGLPFMHDDECAGPGMPWMIEGKSAIDAALEAARREERRRIVANLQDLALDEVPERDAAIAAGEDMEDTRECRGRIAQERATLLLGLCYRISEDDWKSVRALRATGGD